MLIYTRARAEDVRALAGAIVLGSGAGLLMGGAFLATTPGSQTPPVVRGAANPLLASAKPAPVPETPTTAATPAPLRARFQFADITRQAAKPFHFPAVEGAGADLKCLTEVVYFEARGEQTAGQQAVAQVVLNRVRHPAFPKTICGVVHQHSGNGCQFTFACSTRNDTVADNSAWRHAQTIAQAALHGFVMSAVGDATHFQTARGGPFAGLLKVAQIGAHVFYRFGGHAGSTDMFRQTPTPSAAAPKVELAKADEAKPVAAPGGRIEVVLKPATAKAETVAADTPAAKPAPATTAAPAKPVAAAPVKQAAAEPARPTLEPVKLVVPAARTAAPATAPAAKPAPADGAKAAPVTVALASS